MLRLRRWGMLCGVAAALGMLSIGDAAAPLPLDKVAPADDLAAEAVAKGQELLGWVESADAYQEHADKVRQTASLLAVLGQALAEHPQGSALKAAGPSLRQAAIAIARSKTHDEAKAAVPHLRAALGGQATGDLPVDYDWAKLASMHPAMEEMNQRASQLRRLLRRPKDPQADSRHATAIALLAVAAYADTHEVKNPADTPRWQEMAAALQKHMSASAQAIKARQTAEANREFLAGMETCNKCHEVFNPQ
uniref:Cytochrome c n=1 Tax=Schlesneria paludicola TaxID=360056 RepID=A0A7C4QSI7_9PLAN